MDLIPTKRFRKKAQKLFENKKNLKTKIDEVLFDFQTFGRKSRFWRKKLKGNLIPLEELELSGDLRIFIKISPDQKFAILENIGTHAQLNI